MTQKTKKQLLAENMDLTAQLQESRDLLEAIRYGLIDAVVVSDDSQEQIFTLQGAEHPYRILVENMQDGALTLSAENIILYSNRRFADIVKYPLEQVLGASIFTFIPEEQREAFRLSLQTLQTESCHQEIIFQARDEALVPTHVALNSLPLEMSWAISMVVTDLTAQKHSEEMARRLLLEQAAHAEAEVARQRLMLLSEVSEKVAASLDYETSLKSLASVLLPTLADNYAIDIFDEDKTFRRVTIASVDAEVEAALSEMKQRYPPDPNKVSVQKVFESGSPVIMFEVPESVNIAASLNADHLNLIHRLGVVSLMALPLLARNEVIGVLTLSMASSGRHYGEDDLGLAQEVARRIAHAIDNARLYEQAQQVNAKLEQRVQERTAELNRSFKELEAFSYSISHDLRAPLRAINGFASILSAEYQSSMSEDAQHCLQLIQENSTQMGTLIDELLRFSRLGRSPLTKTTVSMTNLVGEALTTVRADYPGRQVEVDVANLPSVEADPILMKQVLINLLGNAFKYTAHRQPAKITVGYYEREGQPVYFVQDNGVGFDMHYVDKLFGVFQRLHRVEEYEGNGVGLAIVQRIIQRHGGQVWAESQIDQGTTLYFTLTGSSFH